MRHILTITFLLSMKTMLFAQDTVRIDKIANIEYAIAYKDCGSFGGYCIYYPDGKTEDYIETHHFKVPKESDTEASAKMLIGFLNYMKSKRFLLITSHHIASQQKTITTTQYIFSRN